MSSAMHWVPSVKHAVGGNHFLSIKHLPAAPEIPSWCIHILMICASPYACKLVIIGCYHLNLTGGTRGNARRFISPRTLD